MASKRSKKSKQDQEMLPDQNNIEKINESYDLPKEITELNGGNNSVLPAVPKAPKRKKKPEGLDEVPKKLKRKNSSENEIKKVKKKKVSLVRNKNGPLNGEVNPSDKETKDAKDSPEKKKEEFAWPNDDIVELINRIEGNIPERDALAYRSRVEKLNWDNVAFNNYTSEECKKTWLQVQKRIRRFRLLREILNDAKEWIKAPKKNHNLPRPRQHPDYPRRPLSSYLLFYMNKKDEVLREHPGMDRSDVAKIVAQIYKELPSEQKEIYEKTAAVNKKQYLEKLRIFFENHPEMDPPQRNFREKAPKVEKEKPPTTDKLSTKLERELPKPEKADRPKVEKPVKEKPPRPAKAKSKSESGRKGRPPKEGAVERPPKKYQTPFGLYYTSELKNMEPGTEKAAFREKCKLEYNQMSDKKKVYWINLAEQDLIRYQQELKAYKAKYPTYQGHKVVKSVLNKREKASKERASGKPSKPPNSAYALFSRVMLQSEEIKSVHPKDRMNYIGSKWKTCTEEEQNSYRDQVVTLMEQYRKDYQAYVDSLPEDERRKIINQQKRKGRRGARSRSSKGRKSGKRKSVKKPEPQKNKFAEPEQPPISPCKYFATLYKGEGDPVQAWKALTSEEKEKYEAELVKKKQAYIVEFEKFLKSLSKEELEAFSKSRQQQAQSDDEEESSECSSGSDGEDEEGDEENEKGGQNEDGHGSDSE